ncbi:hypothetical protein PENVUL_c027G07114 [Penicillium vulpinum]|uniref:BTB domain-containing protein n=1 Tax=Penicillium vulpinum TaxID=29845 RepID=A0A1V6RU46_9EURO|nr:hypothetical protein PENVUL_c027G07114 [Penicillium vulpinum]
MSSDSKTRSKSIFAQPPVKIIVGSDERVYYVHRGTIEVHPAFDAQLKASTNKYEETIDWSGFDEQTIDCVLSFLYTGGYRAHQAISVAVQENAADAGQEAQTQDREEEQEVVVDEAVEADEEDEPATPGARSPSHASWPLSPPSRSPPPPQSPQSQTSWPHEPYPMFPAPARPAPLVADVSIAPDSPLSQALSDFDINDRPLTPLEFCDGVTLTTEGQKIPGHERQDEDEDEEPEQEAEGNNSAEIYLHSKVYSFAHQLNFAKLEQFSLNRLAQLLVTLEQTDKDLFPYLVDAIRLIYKTTSPIDDARNLLSQFVALRYTTLVGENLDELITEGGEFVVDLSHKLARKLMTMSAAFKRIEYLIQKNEELKAESAEKDTELKALREEARPHAHGFPAFTYQI